jgi:MFS family permease
MTTTPRLNPTARGLITLYSSTLLAGMWSMIVPALPVLARSFDISLGAAAQTITALAVGRFVGMPVSGVVLDRLGTRAALTAGPAIACAAALFAGFAPWVQFHFGFGFFARHWREHLGDRSGSCRA